MLFVLKNSLLLYKEIIGPIALHENVDNRNQIKSQTFFKCVACVALCELDISIQITKRYKRTVAYNKNNKSYGFM